MSAKGKSGWTAGELLAYPYFGGKNSKLHWLLPQLDTPHAFYGESHAGSLAVLLNKPRAHAECVNDLSGDVANFWRMLRDRPDELIDKIHLTPGGSDSWRESVHRDGDIDDLERARRFYVYINHSFGALTHAGKATEGQWALAASINYSRIRKGLPACVKRIQDVSVSQMDAVKFLKRCVSSAKAFGKNKSAPSGTGSLFYIDPPYLQETRRSGLYHGESGDAEVSRADHERLLSFVLKIAGENPNFKFALSGYPNELYDDMLTAKKGWVKIERRAVSTVANFTDSDNERTEALWRNYEPHGATTDMFGTRYSRDAERETESETDETGGADDAAGEAAHGKSIPGV